ncbi:MAG TPA: tRNA (N6-isopentenyl adenosine(37)-C2)-methylthiotransferase MiaB [Thermoleophilia bacterium]|nr:tRNA (N6-isopentenyl adenosine(37)-C2)-methylthiotransferase MiaB [Thermoleophilia bacterium]
MRTYYLRSFGCQMNEHDAERIRALLEERGLAPVGEPDGADVLVYNTCTVRKSADDRLAGHLGTAARLKREDPGRIVLVTGCLPQAEKDELFRRFPFVDGAVGPQNLHHLGDLLDAAVKPPGPAGGGASSAKRPRGYFEDGPAMSGALEARRQRPFQAWVQIMSGCTNFCSYCIVPHVRGPERSRDLAEVVAEVRRLVGDGVREVTLLGQNVNAYGRDLGRLTGAGGSRSAAGDGPGFPALLRALDAVDGLERVRFMTSHPKDLSDELVAAVAESPSVCEHVHLPAQAGSDRILAAMRRGYTAEWFIGRAHALREAVPDVSITTDLIAGFPGETEQEFAQTLDLVEAAAFDAAYTFVYSPRRGTAAADLPGQLPAEVKRERVERLIAATQRLALKSHTSWVGRRAEVLVEGASRDGRLLRGRSRQNVTVNVSGPSEPGAIVDVEVTTATTTTLRGTVATATSRR